VAFPERLLSEDEELIYDLRPHWLTLVVPVLLTVLVVVAVGAAWVVMPAGDLQQPARLAVGVIGLAVLLATVVGRVLRWATTHFVLTTERLIFRSGVVAKFGREIPLERINDVTFSQSLFERLIGAGDLLLESAGEHGQSRFSNVRDPEAVQLEIYRQMEANDRRRAGYAATPAPPPPPPPPHPGAPPPPPPPTLPSGWTKCHEAIRSCSGIRASNPPASSLWSATGRSRRRLSQTRTSATETRQKPQSTS
jgi:membrane protein YdbS with pleckstrin-like domain